MITKCLVKRGVPVLPKLFAYLVGLIIALSIIVSALAAYTQSLSGNYYYDSGIPGFLLFVSLWTFLLYGSMIATQHFTPRFYYRLVFSVGQFLSVIFWIAGWAWAASWAAYVLSFDNYSSHDSVRGAWKDFGQATAACAGVGALVWTLCITVLTIFCSACTRGSTSTTSNDIELTNMPKSDAPQG